MMGSMLGEMHRGTEEDELEARRNTLQAKLAELEIKRIKRPGKYGSRPQSNREQDPGKTKCQRCTREHRRERRCPEEGRTCDDCGVEATEAPTTTSSGEPPTSPTTTTRPAPPTSPPTTTRPAPQNRQQQILSGPRARLRMPDHRLGKLPAQAPQSRIPYRRVSD